MRVWLLGIAMAFGCGQAQAGAWPRAPGGGFVALGFEVASTRSAFDPDGLAEDPSPDFTGFRSLYAEFGWTPRLTFGIDAGQDDADSGAWAGRRIAGSLLGLPGTDGQEDATDQPLRPTWTGVVFLRRAVGPLDGRHRFAVQLGIGARSYEKQGLFFGLETMEREAILRPGLAWGMGFDSGWGPGWLGLEGSLEFRADTGGRVAKLDAVAGLKPEGRWTYLMQLQSGDFPDAAPYVRLVPGAVLQIRPGLSLESSVIWGLGAADTVGTKLALWVEW